MCPRSLAGGLAILLACAASDAEDDAGVPDAGSSGASAGESGWDAEGTAGAAAVSEDDADETTTAGAGDDDSGSSDTSASAGGEATCPADRPIEIDGGCYVPVRPAGFHLIHKDFPASWDAIAALGEVDPGVVITSQNRPAALSHTRWAHHTSATYYADGTELAGYIDGVLADADGAPVAVLIDELRSDTVEIVAEAAVRMREDHPQWRGRWGAWIVHGIGVSYAGLQPAIDELLAADARLAFELYPAHSQYCAAGSTASARDAWLAAYYRGGEGAFPQPRIAWLVQRRAELGSESTLSLVLGVTDTYLDHPQAEVFLDRMFYVWRNHSGFGSLLYPDVGGVGAYKWHDHGPDDRDDDFAASYAHYAARKDASSRLGPVPCP